MQRMEQQISLERVAEIMWQRGNDTDPAVKAHLAWLALPEDERRYWCDRAEAAIADWPGSVVQPDGAVVRFPPHQRAPRCRS